MAVLCAIHHLIFFEIIWHGGKSIVISTINTILVSGSLSSLEKAKVKLRIFSRVLKQATKMDCLSNLVLTTTSYMLCSAKVHPFSGTRETL